MKPKIFQILLETTEFHESHSPVVEKTFDHIDKAKNLQNAYFLILNSDGTVVVKEYYISSSSKRYRIFPETNMQMSSIKSK